MNKPNRYVIKIYEADRSRYVSDFMLSGPSCIWNVTRKQSKAKKVRRNKAKDIAAEIRATVSHMTPCRIVIVRLK